MAEIKAALKTTAVVLATMYALNQFTITRNLVRKALIGA